MRNFNFPYFSRGIAEFWRRWHISLTTWFRDYIYIPLGGSRCGKWKVARNTLIIFLVSGFWHGANWTFVCWGAFHALLFFPLFIYWIHKSELLSAGRLCFDKWSKHYLLHERTMYCDSLGLDHKYDLAEKEENKNKWLKAIPKSIKAHTALSNEKAERIYQQNFRRMHEVAELCQARGGEALSCCSSYL